MGKIYQVGGSIRDEILKRTNKSDIDYVYVPEDDEIGNPQKAFENLQKYILNEKFHILTINPKYWNIRCKDPFGKKYDFGIARHEDNLEDENPNRPILKLGDLEQDLFRRDFRINALARDKENPETIIDLFGGIDDLKEKTLRTIVKPYESLWHDPHRILRALRFHVVLGFSIDFELWEAICNLELLERLCKYVSLEVRKETIKIMLKFNTIETITLFANIRKRSPTALDLLLKDLHFVPAYNKT